MILDHMIYPQFEAAAGRSALFELKVRLLADKTKALAGIAEAHQFDQVLRATVEHFQDRISSKERETLELAKKVRNKIVHGDFKEAFKMLQPQRSNVKVISGLENATGEDVLAKILAAVQGSGVAKSVPQTEDAGKFGWLLEATIGGLFQEAMKLNNAAIAIIERITTETALESVEDPEIRERLRRGCPPPRK